MNLRGIQSLVLLLWGWQSDLLLFAIPMAVVWEARFFFNRRWALTKQDFYLLADLTAVALVLMILFLFLNRVEYHFISTLMQWLPILFYPLTITTAYSTDDRLTFDVLFYSLRRQKQPVTQSMDMDYLLFGFLIVASGTSKQMGTLYFPIAALLVFLALLPLRSTRYKTQLWTLICAVVFLSAFATQTGIRETHLELRKRAQVWFSQWIQTRTNPFKTHTAIGQIGKLKLSDTILYRVPITSGGIAPAYLREAVYDNFASTTWSVADPDGAKFLEVEPLDDFLWAINTGADASDIELEIFHEIQREKDLVPVPPGTTRIQDLPALSIEQSGYSVIRGLGLIPNPSYKVYYSPDARHLSLPTTIDTSESIIYGDMLARIVDEHNLDPNNPIESLDRYFSDFRYSLYQSEQIMTDPIEEFLLQRKAGHCEFFATTSVLLLRQMGIPARYVTGYAVQEYNPLLDMFVVRRRHAHAWAIAYVDGRWQTVDTTPSIWLETEADQSTFLQPVVDVMSNLTFMFQVWWNNQKLEDYEHYLYLIGLLLTLFILWRISRGEQVLLEEDPIGADQSSYRGPESPVASIELLLENEGFHRQPGEILSSWFNRIGHQELLALLPLHNKLRFHPRGLAREELAELTREVELAIARLTEQSQEVGKTD